MNCKTFCVRIGATLLVSATASPAAETAESVQTIWNAGRHYETIVKMTVDISNAKLEASDEYNGSYSIPHLVFKPVLRLRTDDIRKSGANYFAKRTYFEPNQAVEGIRDVKWKGEHFWVDPRRWAEAWRMWRNKDVKEWKKENRELVRQMKDGKVAVESFSVFYDDDHDPVPFDPASDSLLLAWSESSVQNFHNGERDDLIVRAYHAKRSDSSAAVMEARGNLPLAENEIQRKIVAECNTLASVLYDDPSGKRRSLLKNRKEWKIDAGAVNKGLLFYGGMSSLIHFEGTLSVRREELDLDSIREKRMKPFSGDRIFVLSSKGAKAGYHVGGRWQPFPLNIDYAKSDEPDSNRMEFWFDTDNNVLRYAHIRIVKEDYDGDIPNPRLGKLASALKGTVKGRVVFELEYWTVVDQPLPEL